MNISYQPLWDLLAKRGMSRTKLWQLANISSSTCQKLRENQSVTLAVIVRLCNVLNCNISDVVTLIKED